MHLTGSEAITGQACDVSMTALVSLTGLFKLFVYSSSKDSK